MSWWRPLAEEARRYSARLRSRLEQVADDRPPILTHAESKACIVSWTFKGDQAGKPAHLHPSSHAECLVCFVWDNFSYPDPLHESQQSFNKLLGWDVYDLGRSSDQPAMFYDWLCRHHLQEKVWDWLSDFYRSQLPLYRGPFRLPRTAQDDDFDFDDDDYYDAVDERVAGRDTVDFRRAV